MSNIPIPERVRWVGGSESAALFGASPYTTRFELWHQKAGNIPPESLDGLERIEAGKHLEPAIAEWAMSKWGWALVNVRDYLEHPTVAHMGCSLDFATAANGEPTEIKNVDAHEFRAKWEHDGDTILDAPIHILIQVQHQLSCRPDAERGHLVACVGGNRLYRMELPRHGRMIARIEREVADFWRSIEAGEEPRPDFEADAEIIAQLYAGDGDEFIDLRNNERMAELCAEYLAAHEIAKAGDARKKAALAEIKTLMHDARVALGPGGYQVSASHIKEAVINRSAFWRFNVRQRKEIGKWPANSNSSRDRALQTGTAANS